MSIIVGKRIKEARKKASVTQAWLASEVGVTQRAIQKYESGETTPSSEKIDIIAGKLNVSLDYIYGKEQISGLLIPVYGEISAGIPMEAIENIVDYEEIPNQWAKNYVYFALKVKGDSMQPRMYEGDIVIVKKQEDIESGDIGIVIVNGESATIKKILKSNDGITLQPLNYNFTPKFYSNSDIESIPITIIGKVIELRGRF